MEECSVRHSEGLCTEAPDPPQLLVSKAAFSQHCLRVKRILDKTVWSLHQTPPQKLNPVEWYVRKAGLGGETHSP